MARPGGKPPARLAVGRKYLVVRVLAGDARGIAEAVDQDGHRLVGRQTAQCLLEIGSGPRAQAPAVAARVDMQ